MKKILSCLTLSLVLLTGCSLQQKGIIKVNDTIITESEFNTMVDKQINNSYLKNFGGADNFLKSEDNVMYLMFKQKAVNELITKTLLENEYKKRGIEVTDEDIKNELKALIDKMGSKEELNRVLKQRGVSNKEFTQDLKTQIKSKKLVDAISNIKISESDTQKYYKQNINKFKHEEQVRASHILIGADTVQIIRDLKAKNKDISSEELNQKIEKIQAEKKVEAQNILKEVLANPQNFEKIAVEKSDDKGSAERGGDLGFFEKSKMVPEFSKAAFSIKPNTIGQNLVETAYGYHIIKVTDRIEAGTTPYSKIKEELKYYMELEAQMNTLKNFIDGLFKTSKIEYLDKTYDMEYITKKIKEDSIKRQNEKNN